MLFLISALLVGRSVAQCLSYGDDFVGGGSYFLNINENVPFSAVQEFSGCDQDVSNNILVDPQGEQYQCDNTPLTPDFTPQMFSCPINQPQMQSGDWSIIILSNNGDGDPIDYQRDFSLSVGPQSTVTVTPTVTASVHETAIVTSETTFTNTLTSTLAAKVVTKTVLLNLPLPPALTGFLAPPIITESAAAASVTCQHVVPQISLTAVPVFPTCQAPHPNYIPDPVAQIVAKVFRREHKLNLSTPKARKAFVHERRARLQRATRHHKRSPDESTVTVTDSNTADFATTTISVTDATSTVTVTDEQFVTSTITPAPTTVTKGLINFNWPKVFPTVWISPKPVTMTSWYVHTATSTKSTPSPVTIHTRSTQSASAAACSATGGAYV